METETEMPLPWVKAFRKAPDYAILVFDLGAEALHWQECPELQANSNYGEPPHEGFQVELLLGSGEEVKVPLCSHFPLVPNWRYSSIMAHVMENYAEAMSLADEWEQETRIHLGLA